MPMVDLPPELIHHIFNFLPKPTLTTCALVCKQWLSTTRLLLFNRISLRGFSPKDISRIKKFLFLLSSTVESFSGGIQSVLISSVQGGDVLKRIFGNLLSRHFSRLSSLSLQHLTWDIELQNHVDAFLPPGAGRISSMNLNNVHFRGRGVFIRFLDTFSSVRYLTLTGILFSDEDDDDDDGFESDSKSSSSSSSSPQAAVRPRRLLDTLTIQGRPIRQTLRVLTKSPISSHLHIREIRLGMIPACEEAPDLLSELISSQVSSLEKLVLDFRYVPMRRAGCCGVRKLLEKTTIDLSSHTHLSSLDIIDVWAQDTDGSDPSPSFVLAEFLVNVMGATVERLGLHIIIQDSTQRAEVGGLERIFPSLRKATLEIEGIQQAASM